jgi:hypothetical protein
MTWGAIGAAAIGAGVSAYSANKQKKAAKNAANQAQGELSAGNQAASQQSWADIERANDLNRANALWAQQQNQAAVDRAAIDSSNAWGGVTRTRDPVTGELVQTSTLTGPWQNLVSQGAGQLGAMQGGLSADQFGINSDVFNAVQALSAPQLQQQRDRENARLAAMGLGTGSGQAWRTAQDALNSSANDMFNRNVLTGNQAWLAGQGNLRNNMAALMGMQTGIKGLAGQDAWAQQGGLSQMAAPTVQAPKNMTYETAMKNADIGLGSANAQSAINNGMWGSIIGGVGNTLANKDVQAGIKDWWSGLGGSGSTPGWNPADPAQGGDLSYLGNGQLWD